MVLRPEGRSGWAVRCGGSALWPKSRRRGCLDGPIAATVGPSSRQSSISATKDAIGRHFPRGKTLECDKSVDRATYCGNGCRPIMRFVAFQGKSLGSGEARKARRVRGARGGRKALDQPSLPSPLNLLNLRHASSSWRGLVVCANAFPQRGPPLHKAHPSTRSINSWWEWMPSLA